MKKITFTILGFFATTLVFAQTGSIKPIIPSKIVLTNGQKISIETSLSMDASLSPGMDMTNKTSSVNTLEVKSGNDTSYTITNTLTKIKLDMDMMGQSTSYDSDKKEDQESEVGKSFADKLNKPEDVILNKTTGKTVAEKKKEKKKDDDESNAGGGLLGMFADNTEDATVTGAFVLVPAGKKIGDTWSDSTIEKDKKMVRVYTLKSITGNEAAIQLDVVMDATNTFEQQGMSMEFTSTTKTKEDIKADITTGQVRSRTSQSDISGSMQVMGQSVPITAKINSSTTYK